MAQRLLEGFSGILVSDFYGGYNIYSGSHQRCWVHLLRLLVKLAERSGDNQEVAQWSLQLQGLYLQGKAVAQSQASSEQRAQAAGQLHQQVVVLGQQYARAKGHPLKAMCQLVLRHQDELFGYVRVAGLAADNNLAERSIRPLTVARKVSGGTRSPTRSKVRMSLQSLFGTWAASGQEPLDACLTMLGVKSKSPVPQE